MIRKIKVQEDVFAEITPSGVLIISERYDGPLGQDRIRELEIAPVGAQALLDLLAAQPSAQADSEIGSCPECGAPLIYCSECDKYTGRPAPQRKG